jgi:hypothetical protein
MATGQKPIHRSTMELILRMLLERIICGGKVAIFKFNGQKSYER